MIRCLMDCLSIVAERAAGEGTVDAGAPEVLELFETFADGTHQLKEERVLFPRLMQQATSAERERLQQLLEDHGRDKHMLRSMQSNLLAAMYGEPLSLNEFVQQAAAYVTLHKRHMRKEHRTMMQMATRVLTEDDQDELASEFERPELNSAGSLAQLSARIDLLCERFGIPGPSNYPVEGRAS